MEGKAARLPRRPGHARQRACPPRNGIGGPSLSEGTNSIRVPFLALVLLSNHVVYKDLRALMDNLHYS